MGNKVEKFESKIDYDHLKIEKLIYRILGKAIAYLAVSMSLGLLIYWLISYVGTGFEGVISNMVLVGVLIFMFMVVSAIFNYLGYQKSPICVSCGEKTKYLYETDQFYCKRCNKYY